MPDFTRPFGLRFAVFNKARTDFSIYRVSENVIQLSMKMLCVKMY
jgi:hypothetical protein